MELHMKMQRQCEERKAESTDSRCQMFWINKLLSRVRISQGSACTDKEQNAADKLT